MCANSSVTSTLEFSSTSILSNHFDNRALLEMLVVTPNSNVAISAHDQIIVRISVVESTRFAVAMFSALPVYIQIHKCVRFVRPRCLLRLSTVVGNLVCCFPDHGVYMQV